MYTWGIFLVINRSAFIELTQKVEGVLYKCRLSGRWCLGGRDARVSLPNTYRTHFQHCPFVEQSSTPPIRSFASDHPVLSEDLFTNLHPFPDSS